MKADVNNLSKHFQRPKRSDFETPKVISESVGFKEYVIQVKINSADDTKTYLEIPLSTSRVNVFEDDLFDLLEAFADIGRIPGKNVHVLCKMGSSGSGADRKGEVLFDEIL